MKLHFKIFYFLLTILVIITFIFIAFRSYVYHHATKIDVLWDGNKNCYIETFKPQYFSYGGPGRILSLLSNESFFVVNDKNGKELKNSSNYFWETQFSDDMSTKWIYGYAMYPTTSGWSGWRLPECG